MADPLELGQYLDPNAGQAVPGAMDNFMARLNDPVVQRVMLQAGLSLMQPSWGGAGQQVAQAAGSVANMFAREELLDRQQRQDDIKEEALGVRERGQEGRLGVQREAIGQRRDAAAGRQAIGEKRANIAQGRAGTYQQAVDQQGERIRGQNAAGATRGLGQMLKAQREARGGGLGQPERATPELDAIVQQSIQNAKEALAKGAPRAEIEKEFRKRGYDPSWLD